MKKQIVYFKYMDNILIPFKEHWTNFQDVFNNLITIVPIQILR
jgi:hypothetical protein